MKKTLSKLLIDRGMTVTELAKKTGISYNTLMNIGKRDLSFSRMVKIADVLDVSLDEFRKDKDERIRKIFTRTNACNYLYRFKFIPE